MGGSTNRSYSQRFMDVMLALKILLAITSVASSESYQSSRVKNNVIFMDEGKGVVNTNPDGDVIDLNTEKVAPVMEFTERYLSSRGLQIKNAAPWWGEGKQICDANPYDEVDNPNGTIDAGIAENTISMDLIVEKLQRIPQPYEKDPNLLRYNDFSGLASFRTTIASFLTEHAKSPQPLNPDNLVILNGCGSVITALTLVLCDENDAMLIPSPHYNGVAPDANLIPGVFLVTADLTSVRSLETGRRFQLTVEKLEVAYLKGVEKGINIKVLFLINPNNPIGDVFPKQLLLDCLAFAKRYRIHVIIDEIFMFSTFGEGTEFVSGLSLENLPDPDRTHVIWGFSKDFAMSGLRVCAAYTRSEDVLSGLQGLAYRFSVPTGMQAVLDSMLSDKEWVAGYLTTNKRRLKKAEEHMSRMLTRLRVPHLRRPAGLYIWADFRKYLNPVTFETEYDLYSGFLEAGVYIRPGQTYSCVEPGWFRIVFSIPRDLRNLVAERIASVIHRRKKTPEIVD